ncbi:hormonally up-regulated neu tumor-associated kinase homolog A [Bombyx mori]|uniref:Protein kinase domain-containing protein n=1 Tax=Bombyx mori TaxID=7091 RepID=A0A8R1WLB9_BOMMO|nr:hormonally up-regulated neu tumor-associated kinase homolog A isoform X1 [Bombyx mori]
MRAMTKSKNQVYSVGNYLMTGRVLGKGHFARVEEATHRIIGAKVAVKVIDLTCIKEEYARRNLHREPRVMARLRHPCIAALYETMMHGPRLYVVMEAAGGGDLCSHVLGARGGARGLPEHRARALAAQLVSAVRHMHARAVVHRDLKMENIMLDSTKQFIKIVDFGLSNLWSSSGGLRTPCGSLEYAAPELFIDGRKYGPEVDLWSIGVIVYGMVTGGLPFSAGSGGGLGGGSRPQLRAAIARGFTRKQRAALACVSNDCKTFIQHLLEPNVDLRMRIDDAACHRWLKRPGMKMKTHPFATIDPKTNREIYRQISELCGQTIMDVVAQIKADPFGSTAGMYNIKAHLFNMRALPGTDLLWSPNSIEARPLSPPEYRAKQERTESLGSKIEISKTALQASLKSAVENSDVKLQNRVKPPPSRMYDNGDCLSSRLPSIDEHSNMETIKNNRVLSTRKIIDELKPRLNSCPNRVGNASTQFYRKAGDALPSWRTSELLSAAPRILYQSNATSIKRASLGNITSPHSSSNSHSKSERALPVGWYSTRRDRESTPLQRLRRTTPLK